MKTWRDRGFVLDSDDEDGANEDSQQTSCLHACTESFAPQNAARDVESTKYGSLDASLRNFDHRCCSQEGDGLAGSTKQCISATGEHDEFASIESVFRPVLALNLTASGSSLAHQRGLHHSQQQSSEPTSSAGQLTSTSAADPFHNNSCELGNEQETASSLFPPQRNFRARKAVQLHPYQVLDAQYQKQMHSRGLAATRVILPSSNQQREKSSQSDGGEDEFGQSQSLFQSQSTDQPTMYQRDNYHANSSNVDEIAVRIYPDLASSTFEEEELPELHELLRAKDSIQVHKSKKRRKLQHITQPASRDESTPDGGHLSRDQSVVEHGILSPIETDSSISSISSSSALGFQRKKKTFRAPPGLSPSKLPTPATSSSAVATRRRIARHVVIDSSPAHHVGGPRFQGQLVHAPDSDIEDSSSSSGELEDVHGDDGQEKSRIQALQKRIKGVLPASWLKLDAKAHSIRVPSHAPHPLSHRITNGEQQAGLARRIFKTQTNSTSIFDLLHHGMQDDVSSPSSSPTHIVQVPTYTSFSVRASQEAAPQLSLRDEDPGLAMEDDTIDAMPPSVSRPYRGRHSRKRYSKGKRQSRLTDMFEVPPKRTPLSSRSLGSGMSHGPMIPRKTRFRMPRLGVLDVWASTSDRPEELPMFLKIAKREAQKRTGSGRTKPSGKVVQLRTKEDTVDAQRVLNDWHAGKLATRKTPIRRTARREPLGPRELNTCQPTFPIIPRPKSQIDNPLLDLMQQPQRKLSRYRHESFKLPRIEDDLEPPTTQVLAPRKQSIHRRKAQVAQLETDESNAYVLPDRLQFNRQMVSESLNLDVANGDSPSRHTPVPRAQIEANLPAHGGRASSKFGQTAHSSARTSIPRRRYPRKAIPQRIDIEASEYRQPDEFRIPLACVSASVEAPDSASINVLRDLHAYGVPYARNFDILPLPSGTYFHESTFVGSGELKKSIAFGCRSLDIDTGHHAFYFEGRQCHWGIWNEEIASDARYIFATPISMLGALNDHEQIQHRIDDIQSRLQSSVLALRKLCVINSEYLSFSDSVDRVNFTMVFFDRLGVMLEAINGLLLTKVLDRHPALVHIVTQFSTLLLVLVGQTLKVAAQCGDESKPEEAGRTLIARCGNLAMSQMSLYGFSSIRNFYRDIERHSIREMGIRDHEAAVELTVVAYHTLQESSIHGISFWNMFNTATLPSIDACTHVSTLEVLWYDLFTILPLLEIDRDGILRSGSRFQNQLGNGTVVRALLTRAFSTYTDTSRIPGSTINDYLRALLSRCLHLLQDWGWRQCDTIISSIFDFFAQREYAPLQNEITRGSPQFLEHLHQSPSLEPSSDDQCFHIFIKIVAAGLLGMRTSSSNKQIRAIAWRWLPNHNRAYDKDQDLRNEDLDALRNQHDLLSTLFWASPAGFQPRLNLIQDLVDHTSSHREACRLNIKAWSNLAKFQMSVLGPLDAVLPFASWLHDILEQNVAQFKLARPELENQYEIAKRHGQIPVTSDRLELMILRNQSGIVASLCDILSGMTAAIGQSHSIEAVWTLLREAHIDVLFGLYDAKNRKPIPVLVEIFQLFDGCLEIVRKCHPWVSPQSSTEESQEYGDWPEDDLVETKSTTQSNLEFILELAWTLLRNVFGSDTPPDELLLTKAVETWSRIVIVMVERKYADLESFIGEYGKSWNQLRETEHRHMYGSYFLACLIHLNSTLLVNFRSIVRANWLVSLMERDAQLKFQHILTSNLLNAYTDDPLLRNPPFEHCHSTGKYRISLLELRERRLGLLSSILSNMRSEFDSVLQEDLESLHNTRTEFAALLSTIMGKMKENYQLLRQHDVSNGSYIKFVQSMVEFMQQYTATDIHPIARWFTDSATFPLPTHDPTYLVGKLRGYQTKLDDPRAIKQLIIFFQTISERASADGEQEYLITQLLSILDNSFEKETTRIRSLRSVLLGVIFPVYIENSFEDAVSWFFAWPLLMICKRVSENLIYNIAITETTAVEATIDMLDAILSALQKAAAHLELLPDQIRLPQVQALLGLMFDVVSQIIPIVDFIRMRTGFGLEAVRIIQYFRDFTLFIGKCVLDQDDAIPPTFLGSCSTSGPEWTEMRRFCGEKLKETWTARWRKHYGSYQVKKGNTWIGVQVEFGSTGQETAMLVTKIEEFHFALAYAKTC